MRTFIGELIFRFKDDASAKAQQTAKNVGGSMDQLERAARRLNGMPWGGRFTAQLDKLGLAAGDIEKVRISWERLHASMASRNLSKAASRAEIENFKIATLGHFASINAASQAQFKSMEKRARTFSNNLQMIMKPALVMMGGYTGAYMVGIGARAGITASSNEQRERARQHFAGLPKTEQAQIEKQSEELSVKYRIAQADAMEIMREARLAMPSAEAAFSVAHEMVQAYKMLGLSFGTDQAITGLRAFNKAMDNINITEDTGLYKDMLDAFVRAQQITGKDMDPEAFAQAVKYSRTAGKVFSPEFLQNLMPFLIAESGGSDTGTQLRATFDNFVGGTATKKAIIEQERLGLRDDKGLKDAEGFAKNPLQWVNDNIVPALKKDGVDMASEVSIAQAVQKFASNRLARDFIQRAITQIDVYMRLSRMMQGAIGLEGAGDVDTLDPFSAFKGFKDSMSNLAAAVLPAEAIASGLNTLADGVNALQGAWREGDLGARLAIGGGAAAGAFGMWKVASAVWGLMTAGTNLNLAAASLQAAAVSLGGAGTVGKAGAAAATAGASGSLIGAFLSSPALWAAAAAAAGVVGVGLIGRDANRENKKPAYRDYSEQYSREENAARNYKQWNGFAFEGGMHRAGIGAGPKPGVAEAKQTGKEIEEALSVTAKPTVDKSDLQATLALINQIKSGLSGLGASIAAEHGRIQREMNRNFSDHGVAP